MKSEILRSLVFTISIVLIGVEGVAQTHNGQGPDYYLDELESDEQTRPSAPRQSLIIGNPDIPDGAIMALLFDFDKSFNSDFDFFQWRVGVLVPASKMVTMTAAIMNSSVPNQLDGGGLHSYSASIGMRIYIGGDQ